MPKRPGRPCCEPGCPNLAAKAGRCAIHQRPAWEGTVRNHGFKSGWEWSRIRAKQLRERPYCQAPGCTLPADEVHQPVKGSRRGLRSLCKEHHKQITLEKAAKARRGGG